MTCTGAPVISVVIPAFNCEQFVGSCIESVQSQSYSRWEIIVVDDGSSDSTPDLVSAYSAREPRLRVLHHSGRRNRGVSASRNLAVKNARGTHLALLDADDEWLPEKLEMQIQALNSTPDIDMQFARTHCIGPNGEILKHPDWPEMDWIYGHALHPGPVVRPFDAFLSGEIGIPASTIFVHRQTAIDAGGFPEDLEFQVEDAAFSGMVLRSGKALFLDKVLARYRVHDQNYTTSLNSRSTIDSYWELYSHLEENTDKYQPAVWNAMLGCVDRYLLASDIPFGTRVMLARDHLRHLVECGHISSDRVFDRYLKILPGHLKRRIFYRFRRILGVGPEPWNSLLFRSGITGPQAPEDETFRIDSQNPPSNLKD
jgi:glycosyltransferase involved in cell wall biosynthesis